MAQASHLPCWTALGCPGLVLCIQTGGRSNGQGSCGANVRTSNTHSTRPSTALQEPPVVHCRPLQPAAQDQKQTPGGVSFQDAHQHTPPPSSRTCIGAVRLLLHPTRCRPLLSLSSPSNRSPWIHPAHPVTMIPPHSMPAMGRASWLSLSLARPGLALGATAEETTWAARPGISGLASPLSPLSSTCQPQVSSTCSLSRPSSSLSPPVAHLHHRCCSSRVHGIHSFVSPTRPPGFRNPLASQPRRLFSPAGRHHPLSLITTPFHRP